MSARQQAPEADSEPRSRPKLQQQPLEVLHVDDSLLEPATVQAVVGLRTGAIKQAVAAGTFPAPLRLSQTCLRWRSQDVRAWLRKQAEQLPPVQR